MTPQSWAGWYRDSHGSDALVISAVERQLRTRIRGVDYAGTSFDSFAPVDGARPEGGGPLSDCVLEWDMPLPVVAEDSTAQQATLSCLLALRRPATDLGVTLHYGGTSYVSGNDQGDFGAALALIQEQLPPGATLQAPFTAAV
ncbi:DUF6304 family protein [Streptomyces sp. NBC_01387]|uniref:DUF6304 family protein n=1 Tax=unclassified Streptomyces TaxID=2593676 RepID=UPI0020257B75|nr:MULTISPECIES: DUF6304 family protein [unclassified Streptomyces]MCX4548301.1 DUF6304 family protein [Streptomyces sp. NBC_01500]WSC19934.1 DUF6304 family protein [Streptomyces sp. NBC_01766]WSV53953.1 DUF6304 family protein [Streptomyces sp. NBC_01014]